MSGIFEQEQEITREQEIWIGEKYVLTKNVLLTASALHELGHVTHVVLDANKRRQAETLVYDTFIC